MTYFQRLLSATVLSLALVSSAWAGDKASDFTLRDMNGQQVKLSDMSGKVVIMSFWATWCGPCKEEMPHLQKLYTDHKDDGLVVLSISTDDARSASSVKPYIKKNGYDFTVLLDRDSTVISQYNPSKTLPYTVIIGKDQTVAKVHSGYNPGDEKEIREIVEGLLKGGAGEATEAKSEEG